LVFQRFWLKRHDDVCNYIAQAVCFSYQSPDVKKQDAVQASQEEEVDEECFRKSLQSLIYQASG
jgi:hypothetical protein